MICINRKKERQNKYILAGYKRRYKITEAQKKEEYVRELLITVEERIMAARVITFKEK